MKASCEVTVPIVQQLKLEIRYSYRFMHLATYIQLSLLNCTGMQWVFQAILYAIIIIILMYRQLNITNTRTYILMGFLGCTVMNRGQFLATRNMKNAMDEGYTNLNSQLCQNPPLTHTMAKNSFHRQWTVPSIN